MADVSTANNAPPVMLRQSSWASREHVNASAGQGDAKAGGFNKNKSIWEKRTTGPGAAGSTAASASASATATDNIGSLRG